jgi:L-ascorbate metabolism protein UlaG (beta-lactamase superfamily)
MTSRRRHGNDLPGNPGEVDAQLTFVGTATTLVRLGSFTVLTDPNFLRRGQRAYLGRGLWSRRLTDPAFGIDALPPLDAVVLSHLHGDHFDRVARRGLSREAPMLTTPHAFRRLSRHGFHGVGLPPWTDHLLVRGREELRVEALPGVHARGVLARLLPPVMGSMMEHRVEGEVRTRIYVSGDTLTGDHLDEITARYPRIDAAVVHLGGTRVLLHTVTMDADQGVDLMRRIPAPTVVPVHHDDYRVFRSSLADFVHRAERAGFAGRVRPVIRGQTVSLLTTT